MWPFSLIPETIDPTIRLIVIILISVQFLAFLGYLIVLIREHKQQKNESKANEEAKTEESKKEAEPTSKISSTPNDSKERERSGSKSKKKLD